MTFFMTVMAVWGSMHLYVFLRVWAYTAIPARYAAMAAPLWLLLMFSPILALMLERNGHPAAARILGVPGMVWAGAFFMLFSVSLVHDLYNGILTAASFAAPVLGGARLLGPRPILAEAGLIALVTVYSLVEARLVGIEHVVLPTRKLPPGHQRIRIAQITDVHLGMSVGRRRLERIAALIKSARPDVIVSTGDLVDSTLHGSESLASLLAQVEAPLGKFAVTGNHEGYAGLPQALEFTRQAGFRMLMNQTVHVADGLTIAGFADPAARGIGRTAPADEVNILQGADQSDFVLVLKHRPPRTPDPLPLRDLQLSGHTHRGQIFPFSIIIKYYYEYPGGLVQPAPGHYLYTSRGTGTWGPPMRFLNPPEVTVVDLVPAE